MTIWLVSGEKTCFMLYVHTKAKSSKKSRRRQSHRGPPPFLMPVIITKELPNRLSFAIIE